MLCTTRLPHVSWQVVNSVTNRIILWSYAHLRNGDLSALGKLNV